MNIKEMKTDKFEGLAVLVPDESFRFYIYEADWMQEETSLCYAMPPDERDRIFLKDNSDDYEIMGKATELTEDQCSDIVTTDSVPYREVTHNIFIDYSNEDFEASSAKQSFNSLMAMIGANIGTWLILKKI